MEQPSLSFIPLPDYYARLLCSNMQSTEGSFRNLATYITSNPGLHGLINRGFKDIDEKVRLDALIKSLGWHGIRNRLAAMFIEYQINGHFPQKPNTDLLVEILAMEEAVKNYTVEGFSRAFLLGVYWKMLRLENPDSFVSKWNWKDALALLKQSKARVIKIDWLLISLMHYKHFFGAEVTRENLKMNGAYENLYKRMNEAEKRVFIMNHLSYGGSIGENDFFYESRI